MLHPYQQAGETKIPLGGAADEMAPGKELFALLCEVSGWLGMPPCIQGSREGKTVYALYRNVEILLEDFWDYFGRPMALISKTWPLCAFGTAENQETVRLSAEVQADRIRLVQQNLSGKKAKALKTLCFQIDCTDSGTANKLIHFLTQMNWQTGIEAVSWDEADFLQNQQLTTECKARSQFCYAGLSVDESAGDLLYSLRFDQKTILWTAYLKDGFEPVEFEWLADEISEDTLENRMEWELALREAMNQLSFRLVNRDKDFEVYDGSGRRRYFGADCRRPAEWAFIKILFPLNHL